MTDEEMCEAVVASLRGWDSYSITINRSSWGRYVFWRGRIGHMEFGNCIEFLEKNDKRTLFYSEAELHAFGAAALAEALAKAHEEYLTYDR